MSLFEKILNARGLIGESRGDFLSPDYSKSYDPFLLNDMDKAVQRLVKAKSNDERVLIYGDYDIDGISATALLLDAFNSFGFNKIESYIPNRFSEGYGLTEDAIRDISSKKVDLIVTVDCGSNSLREIELAGELGINVIVTDHHAIIGDIPKCDAVINPNRIDNNYPFKNLAGVGVAFKLVQAMQKSLDGLDDGKEKWLLDLVALGTICDVVDLIDENRIFAYWGLRVLSKTRRPGLRALMAVSGVDVNKLDSRSVSFLLGPRLNAAGRLETAIHSMRLVSASEPIEALEHANLLNKLNKTRRLEQDKILKMAINEVEKCPDDNVLVLSNKDWNHGIVGIVASKIMEKYHKPTFVLQIMGEKSKGSARSFGDFSAIDAVNYTSHLLIKGGGHQYAAGISILTDNIKSFKKSVNDYYDSLNLKKQHDWFTPKVDSVARLTDLDDDLMYNISLLEPYGYGNAEPVLRSVNQKVVNVKMMGSDSQHLKITMSDGKKCVDFLAFNAPEEYHVKPGYITNITYSPVINEWKGNRNIEGKLLDIEVISK